MVAQGISSLRRMLPKILEDEQNELTMEGRTLFRELYEELCLLVNKIEEYEVKIKKLAISDERCKNLETIPGIGKLTSTAFVASVGNAEVFTKGKQLSAWLGVVPKQNSSGGKTRLQGISKRGDRYLRSLFIHGARAAVYAVGKKTDLYSLWIKQLVLRCGMNKAIVAVANKNIRIAWALLRNNTVFNANYKKER